MQIAMQMFWFSCKDFEMSSVMAQIITEVTTIFCISSNDWKRTFV